MTRGLGRDQIGVSEEMVQTYGELVFQLSNNHQIRRGDPIRLKQFEDIEAHRSELGMSDEQIADRLGLTLNQVTLIRNVEERRRFDRAPYHRLNQLGGGRRFRAERYTDPRTLHHYTEDAKMIRSAMRFDSERVREYTEAGWWQNETLRSWLAQRSSDAPDAKALIDDTGHTTYRDLQEQVERIAHSLYANGLRPGDVLSVQLPNAAEFLLTYLAATHIGAVVSTLYLPHREADMRRLLEAARSKMLVCLKELGDFAPAKTAVALKSELHNLEVVVCVGGEEDGAVDFESLKAAKHDAPQEHPPVGSDPFLLLFTSGTTAQPKAVPLSYNNMLSNARVSVPEHGLDASDRILSAAPFGHLYALYSFHLALASGASNVLLPVFSPPALVEAIKAHQPTALFAGPPHMAACLGAGLVDPEVWSSLKLIVLSGSALAPELGHALSKALPNTAICQLWGMTETQAGLYTRPGDGIDISAAYAGRPSPGTEVRIADSNDRAVTDGVEGELQVRGCLLFPGYLNNPDANAAAFTEDGWFKSGDLATRREDGNIAITGRIKDVINRGGVKYNPREVEDLIDSHPDVMQCAIVSVEDETLGERACCYAVPRPGAEVTLQVLVDYLLARGIAKFKLPERLELRESLPMTPTRKVIKGQLK